MSTTRITIFDTTLRDGEQSPGCSMNLGEKIRLARLLERLGVDVLEAGFPVACIATRQDRDGRFIPHVCHERHHCWPATARGMVQTRRET